MQTIDNKYFEFNTADLDNVLSRSDTEGQEFIQVNFVSGKKVLLTTNLIGFKPVQLRGLEPSKLPRVVTTPDIVSVFEAIQEALHTTDATPDQLGTLKQIFEAVLMGGEAVGINLTYERTWLSRIPHVITRATA